MTNENEQPLTANVGESKEPAVDTPVPSVESQSAGPAAAPPPPPPPTAPPAAVPPVSPQVRRERRTGMALGVSGVVVAALLVFSGFSLGHWIFPPGDHGDHGRYARFERQGMFRNLGPGPNQPGNQSPRGNTTPQTLFQGLLDRLVERGLISKDEAKKIEDFLQGERR